jgi:translation initiation factor eIF-2B subunit gamma
MTKEAQVLALRHSTLFGGSIHAQDLSSRGSNSPSLKPVPFSVTSSPAHLDEGDEPLASLRIGIITHDTVFACRVNNIAALLEANRQFLSRTNYTLPTDPDNRALIDAKSQISSDSMVGSSTKIGERATIKRSVIGRHCVIGKMSRVVGCILLDHCVIGEG